MRGSRNYTRESIPEDSQKIDIYDAAYVGRIFLYMFFGMLDAMWQTTAYWMMGAMSNDPAKLAYFAGFCASQLLLWWSFDRSLTRSCRSYRQIYPVRWCHWRVAC